MTSPKLKFCGLKRPEDARVAERLKANFIGVILTSSQRKVTIEEAERVFDAAPSPRKVGVVGSGTVASFLALARSLDLDVLQVHGGLSPDENAWLRDEFDGELWRVIPVDQATGATTPEWHELADAADALLFDTSVAGKTGGTGTPFDWKRAETDIVKIAHEVPIVLAGGLNPHNVREAIETLHPAVVDVSSGIEAAPGVKDPALMEAFANAVRAASIV
jgi:phosphoribosylanthranilate isomerase